MELRWIEAKGVSNHDLAELPDLRQRNDGFLWLDIPEWDDDAEALLANEFKFHPMAISESRNRNHVPRVHVYPDHVFIVVHAPEIGARGHMHYLELDQFVGENFLITVHGPINPKVPLDGGTARDKRGRDAARRRPATSHVAIRTHVRDRFLDRTSGIRDGRRNRP